MESRGTAVRIGFCCAVAGAGAALTVSACGDEPGIEPVSVTIYARAFCETAVECDCSAFLIAAGFTPPLSCEGWNLADLVPQPDTYGGEYGDLGGEFGEDYGEVGGEDDTFGGDISIDFDQECLERITAAISGATCETEVPPLACNEYCHLYFGSRFEFQPCTDETQCAQGLVCFLSECRDPCGIPIAGEGQPCDFAVCGPLLECTEVEGGVPICAHERGDTGPCGDTICDMSSWCDNSGPPTCRPLVEVGGACSGHTQCRTLNCPAGFCEELPDEGSPCSPNGECRGTLTCLPTQANPEGTCFRVAPACRMIVGTLFEQD